MQRPNQQEQRLSSWTINYNTILMFLLARTHIHDLHWCANAKLWRRIFRLHTGIFEDLSTALELSFNITIPFISHPSIFRLLQIGVGRNTIYSVAITTSQCHHLNQYNILSNYHKSTNLKVHSIHVDVDWELPIRLLSLLASAQLQGLCMQVNHHHYHHHHHIQELFVVKVWSKGFPGWAAHDISSIANISTGLQGLDQHHCCTCHHVGSRAA